MNYRPFSTPASFIKAAKDLLTEAFSAKEPAPFGVMLSGGRTPLEIYTQLAQSGIKAAKTVHILFSDERMVPPNSPDSNYANAAPMIAALGIPEDRVIRVNTSLAVDAAAQTYHNDLEAFFTGGGRIALGLLGLGPDGHTASLFSNEQIKEAGDRWAMPVPNKAGFDRISTTPKLLRQIERIVFLVSGPEKAEIVQEILEKPEEVPAAQAIAGTPHIELWHCH